MNKKGIAFGISAALIIVGAALFVGFGLFRDSTIGTYDTKEVGRINNVEILSLTENVYRIRIDGEITSYITNKISICQDNLQFVRQTRPTAQFPTVGSSGDLLIFDVTVPSKLQNDCVYLIN